MQVYSSIDPNSPAGERILKLIRWMLNGFIILGVIFLIVAIVTLVLGVKNRGDYTQTQGTITGFSSGGYPVVEYSVNGEKYTFVSNSTSSTLRQGQSYKMMYKTANPAEGRSAGGYYVLPIVFGGLALGFIGIPLLIRLLMKKFDGEPTETEENPPMKL